MAGILSPVFGAGAQLFTNAGVVLAGGKITTYFAGTTTLAATWTSAAQSVQNANPIILDSAGRVPNSVWLQTGSTYKFVVADSNNNTLATYDSIPGINQVTGTFSEWIAGSTGTYVNATTFTVPGNVTTTYQALRRVQYSVNSGTYYGTVVSTTYDGSTKTTIVITADTTGLDATMGVVNYGFMSSVNTSIPVLYVLAANSVLTGTPVAPTAAAGTDTTQLATTAFAMHLQSPTFTGTPIAPTAAAGTSTTQVATTAFVQAPQSPAMTGTPTTPTPVSNINTTQVVNGAWVNTYYAPLASPTLTGVPAAPTPGSNVNTTQIPTTAWVNTYYAPIASPTLTGTPAAPTATPGTSTTQIATTAFVAAAAFSAALPSQTGNAGKYVTTDGATASWGAVNASGSDIFNATNFGAL